jgi:hypothetical protein
MNMNEMHPLEAIAEPSQELAASRSGIGQSVLVGIAGGAVATLAMSAVMFGAQKIGLLGEMPPKKVTRAAARFAGIFTRSRATENAATVAAHWGFGMTTGGIYGLIHRGRWGLRRSTLLGAAFGSAVWAVSYAGWVPAMGIMQPPHRDRPFRPVTMAVAHLVFGVALGALVERFAARRSSDRQMS